MINDFRELLPGTCWKFTAILLKFKKDAGKQKRKLCKFADVTGSLWLNHGTITEENFLFLK